MTTDTDRDALEATGTGIGGGGRPCGGIGRLRRILVIGIGTGHPEHVTMQAVRALK